MDSFNTKDITFKRVGSLIKPIASCDINKYTVCFYENPAISKDDFELDVLRYTLKCIYTNQVLFPCTFNTEINNEIKWKVFFDRVLNNNYKRKKIEKLAISLYQHNVCNPNYIFKALGIFEKSLEFNCINVSYENGETFFVANRDIKCGEIITISKNFVVPRIDDDDDKVLQLMSNVDFSDISIFNKILKSRKYADMLLPNVPVYTITDCMDGQISKNLQKYRFDQKTGIIHFYEEVEDIIKNPEKDTVSIEMLEEKYKELIENMEL